MYSFHLEDRDAAARYLMRHKPAEPEMWFFLLGEKVAWTCSRTKRFIIPTNDSVMNDKTVLKYWTRQPEYDNVSLLQWLRLCNTSKNHPPPYKNGFTLVGTKMLSIFKSEHFFQYILLHSPHRDMQTLCHPNHQLPDNIKWYAASVHHFPMFGLMTYSLNPL